MARLQPVRGTSDILFDALRRHRHVEAVTWDICQRFGYSEIATPLFEFTEVFARTLGETTDIVTKEMYTFADNGGDSLTLRPEATAGIARAYISNGLTQHLPLRLFCRGPMFRYERPQKGRQRQFHQVDAEILGIASPLADAEAITMGAMVLEALGVSDRVRLELNTLGDSGSRSAYRQVLVDYFSDHRNQLSEDSLARLDRNPLRILDSKDDSDRQVVANAPRMDQSLSPESQDFFAILCDQLDRAGVAYTRNPRLVRGLDYYCHTAFEFITDSLGAQGTVLGGGRYDGLIGLMGGPDTPAVGWAAGVERLSMMLADDVVAAPRPIVLVPIGQATEQAVRDLALALRRDGYSIELDISGNVGKRLKRANKLNACAAVLVGEDELAADAAKVRNLDSGEQTDVPLSAVSAHLSVYRRP